ncbi:hypothetical protein D3C80_1675920 [compost metagenome]
MLLQIVELLGETRQYGAAILALARRRQQLLAGIDQGLLACRRVGVGLGLSHIRKQQEGDKTVADAHPYSPLLIHSAGLRPRSGFRSRCFRCDD